MQAIRKFVEYTEVEKSRRMCVGKFLLVWVLDNTLCNGRRIKHVCAILLITLQLCVAAEIPGFAVTTESGSNEYVSAYVTMKEQNSYYYPKYSRPLFEVSDAEVSAILAGQGLAGGFPTIVPQGFTRSRGVSFRKTDFGRITAAHNELNEQIDKLLRASLDEQRKKNEVSFQVPVGLLNDLTYIATSYRNYEESREISLQIRITTPSKYRLGILASESEMRDAVENDLKSVSCLSSNDGCLLFIVIPRKSLEAFVNQDQQEQRIIVYEFRAKSSEEESIKGFSFPFQW